MDYFLKASAIIILFYACYKLFLQRDTFFQANRWFLLIGLFIAIVLPLVIIPIYIEYTPRPIQFFETSAITFPTQQTPQAPPFDYWQLLPFIYLAGALFITTKVTLQFISLNRLLKNQKKTKTEQFTFIETEANIAPFSFFNRIVFNRNQFTKNELEHIITHEKVHAKQLHSIDILLTQIATILFWFNPCIWLYKKAMQQNLEFIADQEAQNTIACSKSYQTVLLKASLTTNQLAVTNNFYQSLIKKRIVMLQKSQSKKSNQLKFTIVLPFLALFLMSFNIKEVYIAKAEIKQDQTTTETFTITAKSTNAEIETIKNQLESILDKIEVKFSDIKRNNNEEIINLTILSKNEGQFEYTKHVIFNNIDNKPINNTILKITDNQLVISNDKNEPVITITEDRKTTSPVITEQNNNNTNTVHTQNNGDEIKLVVENTNQENSTTNFKLQTTNTGEEKSKLVIVEQQNKPLYIIDGQITDRNPASINTENIASINVLKGKMAIEKYGSKGVNGVIEITSKNSNDIVIANEGVIMTQDNNGNLTKNGVTYTPSNSNSSFLNKNENKAFTMVMTKTSKNGKLINENINIISDNKLTDTLQFKAINLNEKNNEKPLIYIDEKKSDKQQLSNLKPEDIKSMSVLKDEKAIKAYGEEGKNGIILITTKNAAPKNLKASDKKESSWDVNYGISSTTYTDDETPAKNNMVLHITKNTPDLVLEQHKKQLESLGKKLEYLTLRRNSKKEITKLKMSITNNKGANSKVLYQSNKGIPAINITIDAGGEVNIESQKQD
ncbi:M56 family metallopeptidase [Olleya namhaensis]|uniref:M56 family metallopeptidase n=1 Tax=Olleya namhaensis TaxID=1144750 RepID=UPI0024935A19|nr:M56 family metallopeptidase [Olleya namhaensis]